MQHGCVVSRTGCVFGETVIAFWWRIWVNDGSYEYDQLCKRNFLSILYSQTTWIFFSLFLNKNNGDLTFLLYHWIFEFSFCVGHICMNQTPLRQFVYEIKKLFITDKFRKHFFDYYLDYLKLFIWYFPFYFLSSSMVIIWCWKFSDLIWFKFLRSQYQNMWFLRGNNIQIEWLLTILQAVCMFKKSHHCYVLSIVLLKYFCVYHVILLFKKKTFTCCHRSSEEHNFQYLLRKFTVY